MTEATPDRPDEHARAGARERRRPPTPEHERLADAKGADAPWRLWGPYLAARQWGTVREDYSADGDAWAHFPFEQAHTRAYRWGEDGIAGLTDRYGFLNVALALWNGRDDRFKERLFGLTNPQGNHGEDVKEYWWHLDATPTHSYARTLYRYPQRAFPYEHLVTEAAARTRQDPELDLIDTGILDEDRFFDIEVTHAKAGPEDVLIEVIATNHGPDAAPLHLVPHVWFRNTWSWGRDGRDAFADFDRVVDARRAEADAFYAHVIPAPVTQEDRFVARRAFAGLLWGKQIYRYDVRQWLEGDPAQPTPPPGRLAPEPAGRNTSWRHLSLADVISMPDEWEYPWFAAWDLAFHCVALAHVDPDFAKEQLMLMCREWAMHPNGQLPAYEWNFSDVNPPVHAWAAWQVYRIEGEDDRSFLVRVFTKLLFAFRWWVNRKDADGSNLFEGGFLGMDNVGPFDRSAPLAGGARLEQSDATSWMAFQCLTMLRIAWELARDDPAWDEVATKFFEHFLAIAEAMETFGADDISLWDEEDGFYYDAVVHADGSGHLVRLRSMVGLLPLIGVATMPSWVDRALPDFTRHRAWLQARRPELLDALVHSRGGLPDTLSVLTEDRFARVLRRLVDPAEFLSDNGIRSMSAAYRGGTIIRLDGSDLPIAYAPAESESGMFGGNSNWRGPVWFPVNVLLTDALRTYAAGMGRSVQVEYPHGSGTFLGVAEVAEDIERRLVGLFRVGADGRRPSDPADIPTAPLWQGHPTFSEYFHGDTGAGLGASHQTGWTALVAHLICSGEGTGAR